MAATSISASQALAAQVAKSGSSLLALKQSAETTQAIANVVTEATQKAVDSAPTAGRGQNLDIKV